MMGTSYGSQSSAFSRWLRTGRLPTMPGPTRIFLELVDAFATFATEYSGEAQDVVRNIAHSFYLEALAADDPVGLAELEALRDARD